MHSSAVSAEDRYANQALRRGGHDAARVETAPSVGRSPRPGLLETRRHATKSPAVSVPSAKDTGRAQPPLMPS